MTSSWPKGFLLTKKIGPLSTTKKLTDKNILNQKIYVQEKKYIDVNFLDIFKFYVPQLKTAQDVTNWTHSKTSYMKFFHCQVNFAIYCATVSCGGSVQDHLLNSDLPDLVKSILFFHVYFTTRLTLSRLECPLPGDSAFNPTNNHINMAKFYEISNEYNVGNLDF